MRTNSKDFNGYESYDLNQESTIQVNVGVGQGRIRGGKWKITKYSRALLLRGSNVLRASIRTEYSI